MASLERRIVAFGRRGIGRFRADLLGYFHPMKPYCTYCLHPTEAVKVRDSFSHEFGVHSWMETVSNCCGEPITTRLGAMERYLEERGNRG